MLRRLPFFASLCCWNKSVVRQKSNTIIQYRAESETAELRELRRLRPSVVLHSLRRRTTTWPPDHHPSFPRRALRHRPYHSIDSREIFDRSYAWHAVFLMH